MILWYLLKIVFFSSTSWIRPKGSDNLLIESWYLWDEEKPARLFWAEPISERAGETLQRFGRWQSTNKC